MQDQKQTKEKKKRNPPLSIADPTMEDRKVFREFRSVVIERGIRKTIEGCVEAWQMYIDKYKR